MKSDSIPQDRQTNADSRPAKAPTFRVQTDMRAGWVPGQNVRNAISDWRASLPDEVWQPEIR